MNSSGSPVQGREEDALGLLLRLFVGLRRGMLEFHRAYGLGEAEAVVDSLSPEELAQRLRAEPAGGETWASVERGIADLMIHQASLLEAYQTATQRGSRALLDRLDPEGIRSQIDAGKVRLGPLPLPARFAPILMQAVWEEFLQRFAALNGLDPADYERFFRDGFRDGYREFRATRGTREG